jgi:hypothetical protein
MLLLLPLGIEEETTAAILFWFVTELVWMNENGGATKLDDAITKCQYTRSVTLSRAL